MTGGWETKEVMAGYDRCAWCGSRVAVDQHPVVKTQRVQCSNCRAYLVRDEADEGWRLDETRLDDCLTCRAHVEVESSGVSPTGTTYWVGRCTGCRNQWIRLQADGPWRPEGG
jgi:hypothetical protein